MNISEADISRIVGEVIASASAASNQPEPAAEPVATPASGKTARAAVLVEPRQLEIREFPVREIGPDEILVKVEACGVCGTDVHCYKSDPFGLTPNVLGHEGTGEVVEVGANIKMDSVGKPVKVGDKILLQTLEGPKQFTINEKRIVEIDDRSVLQDTEDQTVTLITCYPFYFVGHAPQRFIVTASLDITDVNQQ